MTQSRSLAFISTARYPCRRNSVRFQRLRYLGGKYRVYFFGKGTVCPDLESALAQKYIFRWPALKSLFPLWVAIRALALDRRTPIAAAYTTFEPLSLLSGFLLKKAGLTWIIDLWDDPEKSVFVGQDYRGLKAKLRLAQRTFQFSLARRVLKQADMVITFMGPETKEKYQVKESKMVLVTNGVDLSLDYPPPSTQVGEPFTITFVGALLHSRLDTLMESMELFSRDVSNFRLVLIGPLRERQDREWLRRVSEAPGLQGKVVVSDEMEHDQVLPILAQADVCVCPYPNIQDLNPTYPIKVFEYMAMGKAVVATRLRGISEIIEHDQSGLLVSPGNPQELAEAIRRLYDDQALRERLGQGARERVKAFEWSAINERIGAAVDDLLAKVQR